MVQLLLLLLLVLLLLLQQSQQQKKVMCSPVGTEAIGTGRCCGKMVQVVGMCGSWAGPRI